jgi:hypothetical protein
MHYFFNVFLLSLIVSFAYAQEQATVFVANEESNTVSVLILTEGGWQKNQDIKVGDTPTALIQVDSNTIFVTNYGDATISVLKRTGKRWKNSGQDISVGEGPGAILLAKPLISKEDKLLVKKLDQLIDPVKKTEIEIVTKTIPSPGGAIPLLDAYDAWANKVGELAFRTPKSLGTLRGLFESSSFDWRTHPAVPPFLEGLLDGLNKHYSQTHQDVIAILNEKKQQLAALKKPG